MSENKDEIFGELAGLEDLAEKKTKIYSRLLTEVGLAKDMETLSARHAERKQALLVLTGEKTKKSEKPKDGNGGN